MLRAMRRIGTSRWVIFAAWILSLGVVFLLGLLAGMSVLEGRRSSIGNERAEEQLNLEAALAIRSLTGRSPNIADSAEFVNQVVRALTALGGVSDATERDYKAQAIAQSLPLAQLVRVVQAITELPQSPVRAIALGALLERWAELDPRSAMAYAVSPPSGVERESAILSALAGWARREQNEAWAWMLGQSASLDVTAGRAATIVLEAARREPGRAFDLAISAPTELVRVRALEAFFYHLLQNVSPTRATQWLQDVPQGPELQAAIAYVAREWARYNPEEAANWSMELPQGPGRSAAIAQIAEAWALQAPARAAEWTQNLEAGPGRMAAAESVAEGWLAQGQAAALATWINEQPAHPDFDGAIRALALHAASADPEIGFSWALALNNDSERKFVTLLIGQQWLEADEAAALEAIARAPLDESTKRLLLGSTQEAIASDMQRPMSPPIRTPPLPQAPELPEGGFPEANVEPADNEQQAAPETYEEEAVPEDDWSDELLEGEPSADPEF